MARPLIFGLPFVLMTFVSTLQAQDSPVLWEGLDASDLPTVYVQEDSGTETEGQLIGLTPDEIIVAVDNVERHIAAPRVVKLDRRGDSVKNGAVVGAVVGALWGGLVIGISDCPSGTSSCTGSKLVGLASFAGFSALVGAGIDALHQGRTTIYERTPRTAAGTMAPQGAWGYHGVQVRYAYSW